MTLATFPIGVTFKITTNISAGAVGVSPTRVSDRCTPAYTLQEIERKLGEMRIGDNLVVVVTRLSDER